MVDCCAHCDDPIKKDGVLIPHVVDGGAVEARYWHRECWQRQLTGGLNHLQGRCTCCGGAEPSDPPGMTRRAAALAAVVYWETHRG